MTNKLKTSLCKQGGFLFKIIIKELAAHLKYLISLLLILGLTINDGFGHAQTNSSSYHQSYKTIPLKKLRNKKTTFFTAKKSIPINRDLIAFLYTPIAFETVFTEKILSILKLQKTLYQQINSNKLQQTFLGKIFTSSNSLPSTYIA